MLIIVLLIITILVPLFISINYNSFNDIIIKSLIKYKNDLTHLEYAKFEIVLFKNAILSLIYFFLIPLILVLTNSRLISSSILYISVKILLVILVAIILCKHRISKKIYSFEKSNKYFKKLINKNKKYGDFKNKDQSKRLFKFKKIFIIGIIVYLVITYIEYAIYLISKTHVFFI